MMKHFNLLFLAVCTLISASAFAQGPPAVAAVSVGGDVAKPYSFDSSTKLKHVTVKGKGHDGKEHQYTGVLLSDIITEAGALPDNKLSGKSLAKFILVKATDGYRAVIALPEINSEFNDKMIILADKVDGQNLPAGVGPYQIIIPGEKKWGRWVRQVTAIDIQTAK